MGAEEGRWAKQVAVSNEKIRLTVEWVDNGYGVANLFVRYKQRWVSLARWQPLTFVVYDEKGSEREVDAAIAPSDRPTKSLASP
jgi:hypothetical protein